MKIVVIGGGKVGRKISEELSQDMHDVTVIDQNMDVINKINSFQDVACFNGNAIDYEVQKEAGIDSADLVIGCTSSDEINMFSCLFAKKFGAKNTIARVRNPLYYNQLNHIKNDLGLSMVINPEFVAANEISRIIRFPSALKVETFAKGKIELLEFKIYQSSPLVGKNLNEIRNEYKIKFLICAIQRKDAVIIPKGNIELEVGDKISIAASHEDLELFLKRIGGLKRKIKTVMIIGASKITYYLCKSLEGINIKIKIIEKDIESCRQIGELLPDVDVIHGDGTDIQLLEEEGFDDVDAFISLTGIDEENIILSMLANGKNIPKVVTKVSNTTFKDLANNFQLDTVVSPKDLTSAIILRYVKAMNNSYGSKLNYLYRIVNNRVEVLEFTVSRECKIINTPLKDMKIRDDLLIACIVRQGTLIIPQGDDMIREGDNIIIVTSNLNISEITDIVSK
ncbi:Trk system potassium transporter TrkA [Peptostreptococcus porci]|uniref:Trk system potassium uptake protein TrkA n=4 Tax=Peptostreptococcus porci TaxID=2652282 RepID=A0A6N7WZU4_9FIRM|nr:Trk system potassium transporter TrkA [Peptostreptococcus porci]MDD7183727.1 Trk system potassium transporter TrkA [Peptostreptococcus porci]MDY2794900.1 Trk system potassium transporter TrkA [Peptostreptococcus porci]MDY4561136.1 Trk system potassium transporter TrkA [Peptostreptococcus porci]MDY5436120.1 Trk system potassium transporter TrkA [Peptostreptococcus porci]MDY5480305.1 Trk system potassium transporter TrkA [Peptostreptococcus porci]